MDGPYYSIRMRASADGRHISGAEKLVTAGARERTASEFIRRALDKGTAPDKINITIENLGDIRPQTLTALDVVTAPIPDVMTGRTLAVQALCKVGVTRRAAAQALRLLASGASSSGRNMRGAMILDGSTGDRLEPDRERGVRASRFDWTDEAGGRMRGLLSANGLSHFRTYEALALATKIVSGPGVLAELCWSDDPDYTAGYVAARDIGYIRFPHLKSAGEGTGGRAIFIYSDCFDLNKLIRYLQEETVLIDRTGSCRQTMDLLAYLDR
jgi:6-carboxyhexanoate--CoA ligase